MPPRKQESPSSPSFESEFERLSTIVDRLEQGNVPLAEMLTLYEEAMALSAKLKSVLTEAELRVEKLAAVHEEMTTADRSSTSDTSEMNDLPESEDLF
jgi:exodeoxyribonuclease VII small subunit